MAGRLRDPQRGRELPRRTRPDTGDAAAAGAAAEANAAATATADAAADTAPAAGAAKTPASDAAADAADAPSSDGAADTDPADGSPASDVADPATGARSPASTIPRGATGPDTSLDAPAQATPEATRTADASAAVGPLTGRTVLLPRSPERAAALAARLRAEGATVLVSPAIERAPIEDTTAMDAAVADLADGAFAWVVVTSVNAIDELSASAARRGLSLAELSERACSPGLSERAGTGVLAGSDNSEAATRWAAVGPATRRALEGVGVRVGLEASVNSARGLLAAFDALADPTSQAPPSGSGMRVLVPQGDLAKPTMSEGLRERGWDVRVVTAYRTVAHELAPEIGEAWRAGTVDVVVLTSGSVAREVASQLGAHAGVAVVAIGEPTAQAAQEVWLRVDAVAEQATDDALADAVLRVAAELSAAELSEPASTPGHAHSDTPGRAHHVSEPASTPGHAHSDNPDDPDNPSTTQGRSHP